MSSIWDCNVAREDEESEVSAKARWMARSINSIGSRASSIFCERILKSPTPITMGVSGWGDMMPTIGESRAATYIKSEL